jgi:3',5'-cyclic AMP phosphodiesterase CpdA
MKFVQITDTHLVPPGKRLHGLDPRSRLDACIADINARHGDAEFCIITGDLVHAGQPEAYDDLKECLSALGMPYHLLIGNHDNRQNFRAAFPETPCDENGFVQSVLDTDAGPFILLDTVLEAAGKGEHWGEFCERRVKWLNARCDEFRDQSVYVFMHHPSFELALPSVDNLKIREPNSLEEALRDAGNVRHLFFGHVHRPISGSWHGIPFSTLRGTNHQVAFDFDIVSPIPKSHEPPAYGVVFVNAESVVVHIHDFLDQSALPVPADARKVA